MVTAGFMVSLFNKCLKKIRKKRDIPLGVRAELVRLGISHAYPHARINRRERQEFNVCIYSKQMSLAGMQQGESSRIRVHFRQFSFRVRRVDTNRDEFSF